MSFSLNKIFTTITANPVNKGNYVEIEPCSQLKPYIRCFWGSEYDEKVCYTNEDNFINNLIIPDICMDIIITADESKIYGDFCGINDNSYLFKQEDQRNFCFGIRFYAWSVVLFSNESMSNVLNTFTKLDEYFSGFSKELKDEIFYATNIYERKKIAEKYLLKKLNLNRQNSDIMNSVYYIIKHYGNASVNDLSDYCFLSKRQLERKFNENTGVSPKQMINLIRYQLLWQECLKPDFNIMNSVEKFGYYDQSHLLKKFRKYHGISLTKARNLILK